MDRSVYQALIVMSQSYEETMKRLTIRAINLMKSNELHMTFMILDRSINTSFNNTAYLDRKLSNLPVAG